MMKIIRGTIAALSGYLLSFSIALAQQQNGGLNNPLSNEFSTVPKFIEGALKVLVMVALPIITVFVVYAGFKFILAQGNPGELEKAKKNFFYVIIGSLLIMSAWILATLIGGTVSQLTG
jgi:hypothetical protein